LSLAYLLDRHFIAVIVYHHNFGSVGKLAPSSPVAFYAGLFVRIDNAYNVFEREILARAYAARRPRLRGVRQGADHRLSLRAYP
jgi:hypothetical protein